MVPQQARGGCAAVTARLGWSHTLQRCAGVPFLAARLAKPAQQGGCEGAVEVTLLRLPWFRAEHQHLRWF